MRIFINIINAIVFVMALITARYTEALWIMNATAWMNLYYYTENENRKI